MSNTSGGDSSLTTVLNKTFERKSTDNTTSSSTLNTTFDVDKSHDSSETGEESKSKGGCGYIQCVCHSYGVMAVDYSLFEYIYRLSLGVLL